MFSCFFHVFIVVHVVSCSLLVFDWFLMLFGSRCCRYIKLLSSQSQDWPYWTHKLQTVWQLLSIFKPCNQRNGVRQNPQFNAGDVMLMVQNFMWMVSIQNGSKKIKSAKPPLETSLSVPWAPSPSCFGPGLLEPRLVDTRKTPQPTLALHGSAETQGTKGLLVYLALVSSTVSRCVPSFIYVSWVWSNKAEKKPTWVQLTVQLPSKIKQVQKLGRFLHFAMQLNLRDFFSPHSHVSNTHSKTCESCESCG